MASLLIEIQTEELPPKALDNLSKAFAKELTFSLKEQDLALPNAQVTAYGSPRRIAALISDVSEVAPDKPFRQKLVPVKVGLDAEGKATPALSKKMKALGIECEPSELKVVNDGKQDQLVYEGTKAGVSLKDGLQIALDHAVRRLPIPKVMSYQLENGKTVEFVRPVKHLVALFDKEIVPVELFGLKAGRETMGHRFHVKEPISIKEAEKYAEQMEKEGKIVASFEERKNKMVGELKSAAEKLNAEIIMPDDLVNEVAALTEWPVVYESGFDEEFLTVPAECLILTMQQNQKYFALRDKNKKLMNRFIWFLRLKPRTAAKLFVPATPVWFALVWPMRSSSMIRTVSRHWNPASPAWLMWSTTTSSVLSWKEANAFRRLLPASPSRSVPILHWPAAQLSWQKPIYAL